MCKKRPNFFVQIGEWLFESLLKNLTYCMGRSYKTLCNVCETLCYERNLKMGQRLSTSSRQHAVPQIAFDSRDFAPKSLPICLYSPYKIEHHATTGSFRKLKMSKKENILTQFLPLRWPRQSNSKPFRKKPSRNAFSQGFNFGISALIAKDSVL